MELKNLESLKEELERQRIAYKKYIETRNKFVNRSKGK